MLQRFLSRSASVPRTSEGCHSPQSSRELLATPRRQSMVKMLWDMTSLTQPVFDEYLLAPIERYAELVQLLPASESHHHAYAGGMLDHALETACYGLRLRQRHLLPSGAKPEDQSSAGELWSAAIIYGSLMHDVAKVLVDIEIHLEDGSEWRIWHGVISKPYHVRYRTRREYHLHSAVNPLLGQHILGGKIMDWLMSQPRLFALLMYTISGHTERGGIIAELIHQADRASVAKALGGDPVQALSAPTESIQRKLAEGLRYLVREQFKLNLKGGMGWLTDETLWLVSPRAVNELKTHLYAQGIKSIPGDLNRLYGELQTHGLIEELSEGKSVWKCKVADGEWQQTFNMIKVPPTLIWGSEDKPTSFSGKVTIQEEETAEVQHSDQTGKASMREHPKTESSRTNTSQPDVEVSQHPARELASDNVVAAQSTSSTMKPAMDDDILSLFPEMGRKSTKKFTNPSCENKDLETSDKPKLSTSGTTTGALPKSNDKANDTLDFGERFWQWLKAGLADHSIVINDTKAPVHIVNGTYFLVSPSIFKRFSRVVLSKEEQWKAVQKSFQKLGLHVRTQGQNIQKVSVEGQNKTGTLMGYLIKDPQQVSQKIPPDNWVLALLTTKGEGEESNV